MKKFFLLLGVVAIISTTFGSCMTMKRDCQGVRHTRLKNGIYL
jgi:hypothetical protein